MSTPNLSLNIPAIGSNAWGNPLNVNFNLIDRFLSGGLPIPGLRVSGDIVVVGSITAGQFLGLDGTFLTSALYNAANGIPRLNSAGLIPSSLLTTQGIVQVAYSSTPVFNANSGQQFKIVLTGDVTNATFANGASGPGIVVMRVVQDATGGHAFAWPDNFRNGGLVNAAPNSRSVQLFAVDTDGSADSLGPIMYS